MAEQAAGTMELAARGGAAGQAMQLVQRAGAVWSAMPQARRTKLMLCGVVLAAACALVSWWGTRTDWKTLYSGLESRDLQQVEGELAAASISYQTTSDGTGVQVPSDLLDKARMEIATKGMPQTGRMGFELFDKPNWVGSEFDEKVNYQRALEGELEHTIATVGSVRSARVHLVLPKDSLFTEQQKPAKASVVLKLKRSTLMKEEVASIRNLVASAVEGLTPDQVTLVDADGRANLNTPGASAQASEEEQALSDKLVAMLEPLAGRENVRATVNITYDQSSQERTDEVVDPAQAVAVQSQKMTQITGGAARPQGIPGTASNTPAADANGKAALPVYPMAGAQGGSQQEESSTFAVTKHTVHEKVGPGRIARITAAVLINDRALNEGAGKGAHMVWRPRTLDEMKRLQELAQAAVGFDEKRGDSVVLQNIAFSGNQPDVPVTGLERVDDEVQSLLRSQPELVRNVGAGLLAALLMLLVVRPVAKQAMALLAEPQQAAVVMAEERALPAATETAALPEQVTAEDEAVNALPYSTRTSRRAAIDDEGVLEYVQAHVRREPQMSTRLLEAWIGSKERTA